MTQSDIACNIRAIATAKGKTYRRIAKEAGFSPQMISDMLAGRKIIRAEYLPQIAKALGVPISRLFDHKGAVKEGGKDGYFKAKRHNDGKGDHTGTTCKEAAPNAKNNVYTDEEGRLLAK